MKRILFTGGSGKAGRHVVQYLVEQGYRRQYLRVEAPWGSHLAEPSGWTASLAYWTDV